jgi:hypothetical protein
MIEYRLLIQTANIDDSVRKLYNALHVLTSVPNSENELVFQRELSLKSIVSKIDNVYTDCKIKNGLEVLTAYQNDKIKEGRKTLSKPIDIRESLNYILYLLL